MPGMDGAEFTREVRGTINGSDVPIIVITAYDDRTFRLQALEAGATDFLSSPVDYYEFTTRARNLLKLQRQQEFTKSRALTLEQQLRLRERSHEELVRNSREALAQVIDTIPALISATDKEGRAVFVNAYFAAFVDSAPALLTGQKLADLLPSDRREYSARADTLLFEHSSTMLSFEEQVTDQSGIARVFLTTKAPMRDSTGNVVNILTTSIDISERKRAENVLRHTALHDPLTDLPNRRMLYERVQQELAGGAACLTLHLIDLDRFKTVNDALGHASGDNLLQNVSTRLSELINDHVLVSRISGDEFAIVQFGSNDPDTAAGFAQTIIESLSSPFFLDGQEVSIGCTIGITIASPDARDVETLLKRADLAMYRAKAEGRSTFRFYSPDMDAVYRRNIILEADLRKAIARDQLLLHYQPQIDLMSGRIVGAEALLRWARPESGLTPPSAFLSLAEESGLIVDIGAWVLQEACAQAMIWQEMGLPPIRLAVNLSPVQFLRQDLVQLITETLKASGLNPELLELELTESGLLDNVEKTTSTLRELKKLGVRISIDDFGMGYSSLNYVRNFPVDRLKIDRSFISNLTVGSRDEAIVHAIAMLAASLELKVTAEGVEHAEQLSCLRAQLCHEAQGYLFSPPVPSAAFEALLREWPQFLFPEQITTPAKKVRKT
jgi:diguanylate cyclase (GGDEF)-like protein/PAS domain S-box-containing protein